MLASMRGGFFVLFVKTPGNGYLTGKRKGES